MVLCFILVEPRRCPCATVNACVPTIESSLMPAGAAIDDPCAPRLIFMSLSSSSAPPCLCHRRGQTAGLHTRASTRREAEGFAFTSPYPAEPMFLTCLVVVRSPG
jgi:hypothetical protein